MMLSKVASVRNRPFTKPLYKSVVKVRYNKLWYTSVENVVAAIEAQFNQSNSPYQPCLVELKPVQRAPKIIPSHDSIYMAVSFNRRPPSPHAVVEIHGELSLCKCCISDLPFNFRVSGFSRI
ncbi:unnamed protein product [Hydatigera taeniaeformis]|uniref:Ribosomal_L18A domain-containing protein n=1 Tax=Hydatigena taeniaeformis TaxID=6205 RepID=A0A0R3WYS7_HYDTA|nr:unnamed protein product [Hydatigera taeniaeformis]